MTVESEDYKLEVLEYAVNQCINRLLPESNKDALSVIIYRNNEVVWKVATEIYTKSGHQIDFLVVKKILNLRLEPLRAKILEAEKIRKEEEAEKARIRADLEAERLAKIAKLEMIKKEREEQEEKKLQEFKKDNPNINIDYYTKFDAFVRIKNIIIDHLEVDDKLITLDYIVFFSRNDGLDLLEFVMAIEEEFDIEIPDVEQERFCSHSFEEIINFVLQQLYAV